MASLGTAAVDIVANTKGLAQEIDRNVTAAAKSATGSVGGLTDKMKTVGIAAGAFIGGVAATAIIDFGKKAVDAASNLGESMNAVEVVFGEASEGIKALGEDSAESFGLSQTAFNNFAVQFSAFGEGIAQATGKNVVDVVDEMTTRIADFASVMNLELTEAATVFQSGLAGETEAFRRFGVDVSAAAVEIKAMELGLGDTSAELTEQEKILARYELIMEQTSKTAGDFENTSDSLANQQRILTANMEDLTAKIGGLLVPAVTEAVDVFNDLLTVIDFLTGEGGATEGATAGFGDFAEGVGFVLNNLGPLGLALKIAGDQLDVVSDAIDGTSDATATQTIVLQDGTTVLEGYNDMVAANTVVFQSGQPILDAYNEKARETGAAWEGSTTSIEENIAALEAHQDAMRAQTDPLFALFEATNNQADAQAEATAALDEFGVNSPEYIAALANLTSESFDLKDAQAQARVATDITREAFVNQAIQAGVARDAANLLADQLFALEGLRLSPIQLAVEIRELRRSAGSQRGGVTEFAQHGGHFDAGTPITVGEAGRELFVPDVSGRIMDRASTERILTGPGHTFNISLSSGATMADAMLIQNAVEQSLRRVAAEAKVH